MWTRTKYPKELLTRAAHLGPRNYEVLLIDGQQMLLVSSMTCRVFGWTELACGSSIGWAESACGSSIGWTELARGSSIGWTELARGSSISWTELARGSSIGWPELVSVGRI